jgi:hypothetical protein
MSGAEHDVPIAVHGLDVVTLWGLSPRFDLIMAVGEHLSRALGGRSAPATVACYDNWSARIAIEVIAAGPRSADTWLSVVEPTDELLARAQRRHVMLTEATAETSIRATVVVAPRLDGMGGNVGARVSTLSERCADHSTLVWSLSHCWPDRVAATRALFQADGFHEELATESVGVVSPRLPGWFVASERRGPVRLGEDPT